MKTLNQIVVSKDGESAIAILKYHGFRKDISDDEIRLSFTVKLEPRGEERRVTVAIDAFYFESDFIHRFSNLEREKALEEFGILSMGEHLDQYGSQGFVPRGPTPRRISSDSAIQALQSRHSGSSDAVVFRYTANKIFWAWRFDFSEVEFTLADHLRLGVPSSNVARVAIAGEDVYWEKISKQPLKYRPLGKLIRDLPAGYLPNIERPPVLQVRGKLADPRYQAPLQHWMKGFDFLAGQSPDLPNSVKEAVAAVESLALLVTGIDKGTLGDCIKKLRTSGKLPRPLDKVFDSLWGYASEVARHGRPTPPAVNESEATFAVNLAAAAICFLLNLDQGRK